MLLAFTFREQPANFSKLPCAFIRTVVKLVYGTVYPAAYKEFHVGRRIEPNCLRTHIQRFLDAGSRVVEESE